MQNIKNILLISFIFFTANYVAAAVDACNVAAQNEQSMQTSDENKSQDLGNFFEKFATEMNSPNVVYLKKFNRLLLLKIPMKGLAYLAIYFGILSLIFIILSLITITADASVAAVIFGTLSLFFLTAFVTSFIYYYKGLVLSFSPEPYLLIDSVGVKMPTLNSYLFKWKDVDKVSLHLLNGLRFEHTKPDSYLYLDKFKTVLYEICSYSNGRPIEIDQMKRIFDHCLSQYGSSKFRGA